MGTQANLRKNHECSKGRLGQDVSNERREKSGGRLKLEGKVTV